MAANDEKPDPPPDFYDDFGASLWRIQEAATIPDSINKTLLVHKIKQLESGALDFWSVYSDNFSWRNPDDHHLPLNELSPVPDPLNQGPHSHCVPFAVLALIHFQMALHCMLDEEGNVIDPPLQVQRPQISEDSLRLRYENLDNRCMKSMLAELTQNGFVDNQANFDNVTGAPDEGAHKYYLHWCHTVNFKGNQRSFANQIKLCIVKYGGALAEFIVTENYTDDGDRVVTAGVLPRLVFGRTPQGARTSRKLGHAVLLVGWRPVAGLADVVEFEFLNSYGNAYGQGGFNYIRSDAIAQVYAPIVLQW